MKIPLVKSDIFFQPGTRLKLLFWSFLCIFNNCHWFYRKSLFRSSAVRLRFLLLRFEITIRSPILFRKELSLQKKTRDNWNSTSQRVFSALPKPLFMTDISSPARDISPVFMHATIKQNQVVIIITFVWHTFIKTAQQRRSALSVKFARWMRKNLTYC